MAEASTDHRPASAHGPHPLRFQTAIGELAAKQWRAANGSKHVGDECDNQTDLGVQAAARSGEALLDAAAACIRSSEASSHETPTQPPLVVLVHGMFGDSDVWAALALNLARAGLDVLAFDLPGHGASGARAENPDQVVEAIGEVLQSLGTQPLLLVGHSFGTLIASRLARLMSSRARSIRGLVLLSAVGLGAEVNRDFLLDVVESRDDATFVSTMARLTVKHFRASPTYMHALRQRILAARDQLYVFIDAAVDVTGQQAVSLVEDLAEAEFPVVLVHGRSDEILPWQHALNAPPSVALHLPEGVGHMPHWEAPQLVERLVARAAGLHHS